MKSFPIGFTWGTATAAFQIEGAAFEDGRTASIWDEFCRQPGKVFKMHNGDVACDHYHRFEEDLDLISELGFQSYRFSIAWPRIFPEKGKLNQKGIDFYKRLVDKLHENGVKPAATIYHWDLPMWVDELGGWTSRESVKYFEEYAVKLFDVFGTDIRMWITHNEPWCAAMLGYMYGTHAPGRQNVKESLQAAHHLLLSHGMAVRSFREGNYPGEIGITLNLADTEPASNSENDLAAARRADGFSNRWFLDPVFRGQYPPDMVEWFSKRVGSLDFVQPGDMQTISLKNDFLGINYYTRQIIRADRTNRLLETGEVRGENARTDMDWEIYPEGLYRLLRKIADEYSDLPIYITENGAAYPDTVEHGTVEDGDRILYVQAHLDAALRFIEEKGNLKGYYYWSFMDNFEWAHGYAKRFGLTYIDYGTLKRIPKRSAYWMQQVIAQNAIPSTLPAKSSV